MDPEVKAQKVCDMQENLSPWSIMTNLQQVDCLTRVRENQRRSRARKQQHVRELEQRLATFQEEARQTGIGNRIAL
jgi:hypothetical protein